MTVLKSVLLLLLMSYYVTENCQGCSPNKANLDLFYKFDYWLSTYYMSKDIYRTDIEATAMCQTVCAYLAEIDDKEEEYRVISMLKSQDTFGVLVSGSDQYKEGEWQHGRTGKQVNYFNWCKGEPNDYSNEDCLGYTKHLSCMWDFPCEYRGDAHNLRYLCEAYASTHRIWI